MNYELVIVTYKGKEVKEKVNEAQGLTRSGRYFAPKELRKAKTLRDNPVLVKKPVTEEEVVLRKMNIQDYSIVEQMRKTPAQISLLSFLIHSDENCQALIKILNEAHVPDKTTVNHLEKIAKKIFESNRITFSDDDFPLEGFDGGGIDSVGDIMLELTIGPVEFTMEFQKVKFEWDRQEIVVYGNEILCAFNDTSILFIEAEEDKGPWVYQVSETVSVEKVPEGEYISSPKLASTIIMVETEMLKNGFMLGKGLVASLQGIMQLVSLCENLGTFGLGFKPTWDDVRKVRKLKKKAWSLPKPVPRLSRSFINAGVLKHPATIVPKPGVDFDEELVKMFQSLFDEVNMVEIEECSSKADVQFIGPKVKLNNWDATPLPTRKEFWDPYNIREIKISIHLEQQIREEIVKALFEYKDIFAWSYDEMPGLSTDLVVHKLPTDPTFLPVKQKLRKFKTDMSVMIKEEITKQLDAKVIRVTRYSTWLANVVPVPKKDGKTRHEIGSFMDCYAGYHQIFMDEEDAKKTAFITPWRTYCYRVMPFGLKNTGATYMRAMATVFHDIIHKDIEVYVDDVIIKSKQQADHVGDLRKFFQRLHRYNLKLNPAKCAFGVPSRKLLGFIVSCRGIELDPSKIKAIQELPPPRNKIEEAFDKIKGYLSSSPVLVPPEPWRPLILYVTVLDNSFSCVLGQHDITSRKE
ncbi:uncharacterized protein [Nicotiana sylvestris]|uniref:uncharacterized protein n=1 Tax=Nicotiana sylvestris TaxID=4096 RepID=UPI00388C8528